MSIEDRKHMTNQREAVARIVNPHAFASWKSLYDYCVDHGDDAATAQHYADTTHGPDKDAALAKADAILSTLGSQAVEPEREAIARVLWFDFVDQQGYPNGLPTWDEMAAWPSTDRNNRCDEYLSYADVIRAHFPSALTSAPKASDGESGRG